MANNYIPGFTPSLHGQPVKRMALGGRMESGRWFNEGRDRDTGDMPYTAEVASAAPAVAQSIASSPVAALTAAAPTAMQSIGSSIAGGAGGLGKWMGQNPYLANMAVGTGMNALTPPPSPPSGGLIAGRPQEIDMMGGMPTQPFMQQRKLSLL